MVSECDLGSERIHRGMTMDPWVCQKLLSELPIPSTGINHPWLVHYGHVRAARTAVVMWSAAASTVSSVLCTARNLPHTQAGARSTMSQTRAYIQPSTVCFRCVAGIRSMSIASLGPGTAQHSNRRLSSRHVIYQRFPRSTAAVASPNTRS